MFVPRLSRYTQPYLATLVNKGYYRIQFTGDRHHSRPHLASRTRFLVTSFSLYQLGFFLLRRDE